MQSNGKINEESPQQPFELLLLTIERDLPVLSVGLPFIIHFLMPRKIMLIASSHCLEKARSLGFHKSSGPVIEYLDEDTVVPGLSLASIKACIQAHGGKGDRAGWYFKQLLLLAYATQPSPYRYYLVWDTDTIPVRPLSFFDGTGRVLMTTKTEIHPAYFRTMEKLIGIGKVMRGSFIAEHMMFERPYVSRLLACIMKNKANDKSFDAQKFIESVIAAIEPEELDGSGFSEYETYGSFMYRTARDCIALRDLPSMRLGSSFFDRPPTTKQLFALSRHYYWASFETWHSTTLKTRAAYRVRHMIGTLWTNGATFLKPKRFDRFQKEIAHV
ncbi:MAG TPA: hypothetical protein PK712_00775 [Rectinema sp.]|jgi:hypothetical protein|nr:hypothetical protein [Spirochaetota bacterium]OQC74751.1 MAG: hypothetical protein BWX44_00611 [Spirochaetes bacterium ADurb.Bin001]HPG95750.1 hypothetical protein [Rectinema sp.]HPN02791.1 hypothetical protein [Rectinema sp.]HPW47487.1 hypothetical protein [Rectinema sp.]